MAVPDTGVSLRIDGAEVDVTDRVLHGQAIRYAWGRRAEGSRTDPAAASLVLRNHDGRFTGRNPLSPYYGKLGRNTPLTITHGGANMAWVVPPGVEGRATTPDAAALDITGDIDIRFDITPDAWGSITNAQRRGVMGKWGAVGQQSWRVTLSDGGKVVLIWTPDGTNPVGSSTDVPLPFAPGQRGAVRATLDVNNGSGGWTATYYTAATLAGPWTQLGTPQVTTSGTTSIFNSTAPLEVGTLDSEAFDTLSGEIHAVEVRSGIGGSVVANPNFAGQTVGATVFADAAGRTWTVASGSITNRRVRAVMEASSWTPRWTNSVDVTTPITAGGLMRRLGAGSRPLASTLRRTAPVTPTTPAAYWPMEDGSSSTSIGSAVPGAPPLLVTGFSFAAESTCAGSSPLPTIGSAASMSGAVPTYASPSEGWTLTMMVRLPSMPASKSVILGFQTSGTGKYTWLCFTSTALICDTYSTTGVLLSSTTTLGPLPAVGEWWKMELTAQRNGANTDFEFFVTSASGGPGASFSIAGTPGNITRIETVFDPLLNGAAVGHLVVYPTSEGTVEWWAAREGNTYEAFDERVLRLCNEEGIPLTIVDWQGSFDPMGPQRPARLLDLLGEIEQMDGGILYEDPRRLGLVYRTRRSLYSQPPKLTVAYSQLVAPLDPTDDDRNLRNDRTAQREGGSSARTVLESGPLSVDSVGLYDDSTTVNVYEDSRLPDIAAWLLHLGTQDEYRYPRVRLLLHKYPDLVPAACALRPGDIIQITGTPAWLPPGPIRLMVQGGEEDFKTFEWTMTLSCSPANPWTVALLDDTAFARLDMAGSTLASGVTATATSLSVATSAGPLWSTVDEPYDIKVGGEVITVTAVTGASSPQTATVTRSVNGVVKAHSAGAAISLAQPAVLAL
ncbi:hypothetical protein [Streptomyces virginiae]|uniref:hypothetical protein n=1 Tax=Streptomyces virginiae TaxID=1961 RepID=UPI0036934DAA